MTKREPPDAEPLPSELARGFRKRTWVTARLLGKVGVRMARGGNGTNGRPKDVARMVAAAEQLADQLGGLKGLALKVGQMMSYLDHMLPPEAQRALAKVQAHSSPLSYDAIARVVEAELGAPPEALFEGFSREPVAAASIGQVHRAVVQGRDVAVKVQYPDIEPLLAGDLKTLSRLTRMMFVVSPVDGKGLLDELATRIIAECDYEAEARNQRDFGVLFEGWPDVRIPAVLPHRSARRVLTTTYVDAMDFYLFRDTAPPEVRNRAAATIYRACFQSLFHRCVYNADPHPGNYLFDGDGRVTLLDFGCVKRFSAEFIDGWKRIARAVLDDDVARFRVAWKDAGFVGRERGFDYAHQLAAMRLLYAPMLSREPFTFTAEFVHQTNDAIALGNRNKFKLNLPSDWLFVNRLQYGLHSVLSLLEATADWRRIFRDAIESPTAPFHAAG